MDNGPASEESNDKLHQVKIKNRAQGRNSFKMIASLNIGAV